MSNRNPIHVPMIVHIRRGGYAWHHVVRNWRSTSQFVIISKEGDDSFPVSNSWNGSWNFSFNMRQFEKIILITHSYKEIVRRKKKPSHSYFPQSWNDTYDMKDGNPWNGVVIRLQIVGVEHGRNIFELEAKLWATNEIWNPSLLSYIFTNAN